MYLQISILYSIQGRLHSKNINDPVLKEPEFKTRLIVMQVALPTSANITEYGHAISQLQAGLNIRLTDGPDHDCTIVQVKILVSKLNIIRILKARHESEKKKAKHTCTYACNYKSHY